MDQPTTPLDGGGREPALARGDAVGSMRAVAVAALGALACGASPVRSEGPAGDVAAIEDMVAAGRKKVEAWFGAPFPHPFVVHVYPNRAAFTARMREAWKEPNLETQCWMVGVGMATELMLLAPSRWRAEACEHNPDDRAALARLIVHEIVHVYHSQMNPRLDADPDGMEPLGWFVEGLAVLVSGQLDDGHLAPASEAVRVGAAPTALAAAWSGKYRYGVSGSIVGFIERAWGRPTVVALLRAQSPADVLGRLGVTEPELLARWRAAVAGGAP